MWIKNKNPASFNADRGLTAVMPFSFKEQVLGAVWDANVCTTSTAD